MKELIQEIELGWKEESQDIALQFMKENGYKLTEMGKNQALNDLDILDPQPKYATAIKTAIALLNV